MGYAALTLSPDCSGHCNDLATENTGNREVEQHQRIAFLQQSAFYLGVALSAKDLRTLSAQANR